MREVEEKELAAYAGILSSSVNLNMANWATNTKSREKISNAVLVIRQHALEQHILMTMF